MATAERETPPNRARAVTALFVVVVAGAVALWLIVGRDETADGIPSATTLAPVAVDAASVYEFATLEEMVTASDAIVVGAVVAVERGRLVGDPGAGGVVSRIVTLAVERVIAGGVGATVLVEEEGWLPDGTPLIVNGVAPSAVGDRGLWFLDDVAGTDVPTLLVINSQGRFLAAPDGSLTGGDQRDDLVRQLQQLSLDELVAHTLAAAGG